MVAIGFIGLGVMGEPMSRHLLDAAHDVVVFDLDEDAVEALTEAGADAAADPAEVGRRSEVIFLSLPTPSAVETVVDRLIDGLEPGSVVVDTTTSLPATTAELAARLDARDVDLLGAPVSGGRSGSESGTLSIMVGGPTETYLACQPLFECFAANQYHVGERPEYGHAIKLLNNYLSITAMFATSEAVVLGERLGLDAETMVDVFNASSGRNSATDHKFPDHVLAGDFDMGFTLGLMTKDIRLLTEFGGEFDTPMLLAPVVEYLSKSARFRYGPDADMTRCYTFVDELADDGAP